jgi:hypothetical protein
VEVVGDFGPCEKGGGETRRLSCLVEWTAVASAASEDEGGVGGLVAAAEFHAGAG